MVVESSPKKALGQHWLYDKSVLEDICESIGISDGDHVLEIGPGLGTLTAQLLEKGARVRALEFDHDLATSLSANIKKLDTELCQNNLETIEGDIRTFDFSSMAAPYIVCANIPYYLTSHLLRQLCDTSNKPTRVALLIQKEVAERVVAEDGKMSILSCFTQFYYDCYLGSFVPAKLFTPPPKVDSQVLILHSRVSPLFDVDEKQLFRVVKAGFSGKRKNLRNTLSAGLRLTKEDVETACGKAVIDPHRRAETLSLFEWKSLYDSLDLLSSKA